MSVNWLLGLLLYWNKTNIGISPGLSDFFGYNPGMFVYKLQSILHFLYVYLSVCWNKGICPVLHCISFWIFCSHSFDVCTIDPINSQFLICLSVCYLDDFFTELGYVHLYMKYFLNFFQINPNFLYVCQSLSQLTSLLK